MGDVALGLPPLYRAGDEPFNTRPGQCSHAGDRLADRRVRPGPAGPGGAGRVRQWRGLLRGLRPRLGPTVREKQTEFNGVYRVGPDGAVTAIVYVAIPGDTMLEASVTIASLETLKLYEGKQVVLMINPGDIIIGCE